MPHAIYTIGHSNHTPARFLELLNGSQITAIGDVRSQPFSRFNPGFSRDVLKVWLGTAGVQYAFLGHELGARSTDPGCYQEGKVVYRRLASQPHFQSGLDRVVHGAARHRIALLCAEKEPLDCHRTILISRQLVERGLAVLHILPDGSAEPHAKTMLRLLSGLGLDEPHMFRSDEETLQLAYERQEQRIAYQEPDPSDPELVA
jgi:uncharacterized protein (DUF488 family)